MAIAPHATPFSVVARPEHTDGRRIAVLLCHRFTGTPDSLRAWGAALGERGYAVEVPRLPGHGTSWREMNHTRWEDWYGEVRYAFDRLVAGHDAVFAGGLGMGGGLSLRLAADRPDGVAGLLLVNPAVTLDRRDVMLLPVLKHVVAGSRPDANDIRKDGEVEKAYRRTPLRAADSMLKGYRALRTDLAKVTAPILMFRSVEDHVVDPSSARIIGSSVSSREVEERLLEHSYHVATQDNDAEIIVTESAKFIERVAAP